MLDEALRHYGLSPPRARGCTSRRQHARQDRSVTSARAWMYPRLEIGKPRIKRYIRARVDVPPRRSTLADESSSPPRARGCTIFAPSPLSSPDVSSVLARMNKTRSIRSTSGWSLLCARGCTGAIGDVLWDFDVSSAHTWMSQRCPGWSLGVHSSMGMFWPMSRGGKHPPSSSLLRGDPKNASFPPTWMHLSHCDRNVAAPIFSRFRGGTGAFVQEMVPCHHVALIPVRDGPCDHLCRWVTAMSPCAGMFRGVVQAKAEALGHFSAAFEGCGWSSPLWRAVDVCGV